MEFCLCCIIIAEHWTLYSYDSFLLQLLVSGYRFEPDMLAFSGCYYGGGDKEKRELGAIRKRWKTLHVRLLKPHPDLE